MDRVDLMDSEKRVFRCPRCNGRLQQPGALSRVDNQTEICSDCGTREALEQVGLGNPLPMKSWWIAESEFAEDIYLMQAAETS